MLSMLEEFLKLKWMILKEIRCNDPYGDIHLPPTCEINYVNMQLDYVHMRFIHVNMQHNYVVMQYNYANMRDDSVNMRLELCCIIIYMYLAS